MFVFTQDLAPCPRAGKIWIQAASVVFFAHRQTWSRQRFLVSCPATKISGLSNSVAYNEAKGD
jgi:hypothetical protein